MINKARSFKDLNVYQKAFEYALVIHAKSLEFPKIEQYALADQMRRASKSICANIAEGYGKQSSSHAEFKRFISMAIGSANEMIVWTEFCAKLDYISSNEAVLWADQYDHIAKMLNKLRAK